MWKWLSSVTMCPSFWFYPQWRRCVWFPDRMTPWQRKRTSHCSLSKSSKWVSFMFYDMESNGKSKSVISNSMDISKWIWSPIYISWCILSSISWTVWYLKIFLFLPGSKLRLDFTVQVLYFLSCQLYNSMKKIQQLYFFPHSSYVYIPITACQQILEAVFNPGNGPLPCPTSATWGRLKFICISD